MISIKLAKNLGKITIRKARHLKNVFLDTSPKLLVLVYHRVLPRAAADPLGIILSETDFIRQIDALAMRYPIITLGDAVSQSMSGKAMSEIHVALTFDDGYRDNYDTAFPILKRKGLPATFFIPTDYIGADRPLWEREIITEVYRCPWFNSIPIEDTIVSKRPLESKMSFALRVFEKMKGLKSETFKKVIDRLRDQTNGMPAYDYSGDRCMSWVQVEEMSRSGMEIGAHGMSHRSLSRIPFDEALVEIKESKATIETNIRKVCDSFAFPFGSVKDYNQILIDHVKSLGFRTCVLNIHGYNRLGQDIFCLKRIIMNEFTDVNYLLG